MPALWGARSRKMVGEVHPTTAASATYEGIVARRGEAGKAKGKARRAWIPAFAGMTGGTAGGTWVQQEHNMVILFIFLLTWAYGQSTI